MDNQAYKTIVTGEVGGSLNAKRLPNIACSKVNIKAQSGNATNVYLGSSSSVTVASGGSVNTTTGFELDAGQETGWIEIDNLNKLWMICNAGGDDITYIALR
jgi:hypothetical protein